MNQRQIANWLVLKKLGSGAQGLTSLVERADGADSTRRALKQMKRRPKAGDEAERKARGRFRREVETLRILKDQGCSNIVEVIDADLSPSGDEQPWFVMPYYAAGPMWDGDKYVEPYQGNVDRVLAIAESIAQTLAFIHGIDAIHRDVKAGNVFLDEVGGPPILGDFGIVYTPNDEDDSLTATGETLGPQRWRPPELRRGGRMERTPKSDVYMLGGLVYECLTGGENLEEIERSDGTFAHELPAHTLNRFTTDERMLYLNGLLREAFRRDPSVRISAQHFGEVASSIRSWTPGTPPPSIGPSPAEKAAAEYRTRSHAVRDEQVRLELQQACDRVSTHFGEGSWAPKNEVTKMIATNWGDTEPLQRAKAELPDFVWMCVRVTVAFETYNERPMFMAYVFLGRHLPEEEVVAVFDEESNWTVAERGPIGDPRHEQLMCRLAQAERERLLTKIAPIIEQLR